MPKESFSIAETSRISSLKPGARIHFIGVCGVAMGQLAMCLKSRGYAVSGSDKDFYEPMGSELARSGIKLCRGYAASNISDDLDLVVIGNVVSYGHEEVLEVERKDLPYTLFPKALAEVLIADKNSLVVSGTHGKSTTTALIAGTLRQLGQDPSYFVGGVMKDFPESLHVGSDSLCVIEGDEYDSAFFAKVPKFTFYQARFLIVTSIEYDHADIYPSLESINAEFDKLVAALPAAGALICALEGENLSHLVEKWRRNLMVRVITYGDTAGADYHIVNRKSVGGRQVVSVESIFGGEWSFELALPGRANALNALAGILAAECAGIPREKFLKGLPNYRGVKRRQELRLATNGLTLIEDFAHHPTAVKETISAIREFYPGRLWAVFEPRSNTSRRKIFRKEYINAFRGADKIVLCDVIKRNDENDQELLDVNELSRAITNAGGDSICLVDSGAIGDFLLKNARAGDILLIMSNGSFGGLISRLEQALSAQPG